MEYQRRVVDAVIDDLLPELAAIAIEGPKGVGKTATAARRAKRAFALDIPEQLEIVTTHPAAIDVGAMPVLLDEWQRQPQLWDYVRRRVDAGAAAGSYLLTGSAAPLDAPLHSGAGRIVPVRMRPMSLAERGLVTPTVSLAALLSGARPDVNGSSPVDVGDYIEEILASGFPGIRPLGGRARRAQLDGYLSRITERDFPEQGLPVRRPDTLRAWMTAYAAATASTAAFAAINRAAHPGEGGAPPAKTTTIAYRDVLAQLYLLDPVPGWVPSRNHFARAAAGAKHHLADPALAARLLGVDAAALLGGRRPEPAVPRDGTLLGALFESLVTLSVRTYAEAAEARTRHLRLRDGTREIDLIIERDDQRVVALEVKLSSSPRPDSIKHLMWLRETIGDDLLDAAIITTGEYAYRRDDGIAVIPAALLGP